MWETRVRALEKEMAIHSSTIAWKIPWTEEPGRLQSMGSQRVGHDWATSLSLSVAQTVMNLLAVQETWVRFLGQEDRLGRKWQPTSGFLPGEFHGQRNLKGCSSWSGKESDMTEQLTLSLPIRQTARMNSLMWLTWERQKFSSHCILNPLQSDFYFHLSTEMTLLSISKDSMLTQGLFFHLIWSSSSIWHTIYYGFLRIASPFGFSFTWVVLSSYFPLLVSSWYLRKCSFSPDLLF